MANYSEVKISKDTELVIDKDTHFIFEGNCKLLVTISGDINIKTTVKRGFDVTRVLRMLDNKIVLNDTFNLENGSTLNNLMVDAGVKDVNANIIAELIEDGTKVKHYFVTLAADKAKKKFNILALNKGKQTFFDITHYSLCCDNAEIDVQCNATMKEGCVGSGNEQILKAIMLSENAKATVDPLLIIDEPDLEAAGHGATIGKVDEEQLYYLMSRGITSKQAKLLIIKGFFNPVFDEIHNDEFKNEILTNIEKYVG